MADNYTENGVREDLNDQVVKIPRNGEFIAGMIMPVEFVAEKAGKVYVATKTAAAAQTNRDSADAPTLTQVATSPVDYSTGEIIGATRIAESEVKSFGGVANADLNGAAAAIVGVQKALEIAVAKKAIPAEKPVAADADAVVEAVEAAADALTGFIGKRMIVGSVTALRVLERNILASASAAAYKQWVALSSIGEANNARRFESRCAAMASFFGVDRVLAGRDDCWGKTHTVAVGVFDGAEDDGTDGTFLRYKQGPVFGRQLVFLPDPAKKAWPYTVESIADRKTRNNLYYATAYSDCKVFNAGACATVGLYAEDDSSESGSESESESASV